MTKVLIIRFLVIMWYAIITYFIAYGVLTDPDAVEELNNTPEVRALPKWLVMIIIVCTCAFWPIWILRRLSHLPSKLKKHISRPNDEAIKSDDDVDSEDWRNYWRN